MEQAIKAYRHVSATDEFKELERIGEAMILVDRNGVFAYDGY